jgi:hypothetical protein
MPSEERRTLSESKGSESKGITEDPYERPMLTPIGNLNDVLAASTQPLESDNGVVCGQPTGHITC